MAIQVSTIIPTYNSAKLVEMAVRSALAQRQVSHEVIVVDDASTDDTRSILESFGNEIKSYSLDHGGPYQARNFGVRESSGEWLAFLDADDEWEPDKLAKQLERAGESTAMVYTNCRNIGDTSRVKPLLSDNSVLYEGQIFRELLLGNFISLSSVIIRRQWFDQFGGFPLQGIGVQDWDLWLQVAAGGGEILLCEEPLTLYRHHPGQMSQLLNDRLNDRLMVLGRWLKSEPAKKMSWSFGRRAYANAWRISGWSAAATDNKRALRYYLRSASYWPFETSIYRQIFKCALERN